MDGEGRYPSPSKHTGGLRLCTNSVDCSVRSLWRIIQIAVDRVLEKVSLLDLMGNEYKADNLLQRILEQQILSDPNFLPSKN